MSAFQVFGASTSHMTKKNRAAWNKAGLLGKDGDIIDRGLYQKDPYEWVWKDMLPKLAAQGIKDRDQILRWLTDHGQRSTVSGILADIAIGQTPITNTATKMENQNPNLVEKLTQTDVGKLAALHTAENNFFVALGKFGEGPGIALLTSLTKGLNSLTDWANVHPDTATKLIMIGGGLALISKVAGDAAMASIFVGGPLIRGITGLGSALIPFAAGGPAGSALAALSAAKGAGSLFGLAGGILAVGAAMLALPPVMDWLMSDPNTHKTNVGKGARGASEWSNGPPQSATQDAIQQFWDGTKKFWNGTAAAPGTNAHRGTGDVHVTVQLDGKTIAKAIQRGGATRIPGVQTGMTGFDPSIHPYPAAAPTGGN